MSRPTLLILSLVVILVVATTWLSQRSGQAQKPASAKIENVADYFIRGFEGTMTNEAGKPSHRLKSKYMVHYSDSDATDLEQPELIVYREQGEQWEVSALQGQMGGESDKVLLSGEVLLRQKSEQRPMQLRTDTLELYPERHYAETDSAVSLSAPGGQVTGVGMKVFGDEQRLLLLSNIRGTYEAKTR